MTRTTCVHFSAYAHGWWLVVEIRGDDVFPKTSRKGARETAKASSAVCLCTLFMPHEKAKARNHASLSAVFGVTKVLERAMPVFHSLARCKDVLL